MASQLLEEMLERLVGFVGGEVVLLQAPDLAGEIVRQQVELEPTIGHRLRGDLLAPLVAALLRQFREAVERGSLGVDHVAEPLGDVVVDAAEIVALEGIPLAPPQLLEQLA